MEKTLYNVYDGYVGDRMIIKSANAEVVREKLGISRSSFFRYLESGSRCRGRYRLERVECKGGGKSGKEYTEDDFGVKFGYDKLREWKELNRRYGRRCGG